MHSIDEIAHSVENLLGEGANALAIESGVTKRHSKITGSILALVLVTGFISNPTASLNQLSQIAGLFGTVFTRAALSQRFNPLTVGFFRKLFEEVLQLWQQREGMCLKLFEPFGGVYLIDSTHLALSHKLAQSHLASGGNGVRAGMKLQVTYDYLQQQVEALTEQASLEPDQSFEDKLEKLPEGGLILFDLGYCTLERLKRLRKAHYFLTRLPTSVNIYQPGSKQPLDLVAELRLRGAEVAGAVLELSVEVGQKERLELRVVAPALPEEAYLRRLAQARKASQFKGRELGVAKAERLRWNLYLTNVNQSLIGGHQVGLVYHLRWQIELLFKLWKSGRGLEQTCHKKVSRVWCEIYARLIGYTLLIYLRRGIAWNEGIKEAEEESLVEALVGQPEIPPQHQWKEAGKAKLKASEEGRLNTFGELALEQAALKSGKIRELSLPKALQTLRIEIKKLGKAIATGKEKKLKKAISRLRKSWRQYSLKENRTDRPSSYEQVRQSELLARGLQSAYHYGHIELKIA